MTVFRHAGDLGDIVYSLPVVRHMGGGVLYIEAAPYTRQKLTRDKWCGIDRLLAEQPYISGVTDHRPSGVTVNLNDFRQIMFSELRVNKAAIGVSLQSWMLRAHRIPTTAADEPWLQVAPPADFNPASVRVVINRTGPGRDPKFVYHNPEFPWRKVLDTYGDACCFIGSEHEWRSFCGTFGPVPWCSTPSLYEAAQVIAACDLFIGNQSVCHAIAEAMKKRIVLEVWPSGPNCLFHRPGVVHGWDHRVELPAL